ncbi:hypothetical protein WMY93_003156 [Mugilogobius chulae]|uniref:Myb/SANT-like DNA-binding domain-containing protein n=1 Tax=Mugilogobius chulae TaxID=88201 RepID=A0AAW0Q431_9GOBI
MFSHSRPIFSRLVLQPSLTIESIASRQEPLTFPRLLQHSVTLRDLKGHGGFRKKRERERGWSGPSTSSASAVNMEQSQLHRHTEEAHPNSPRRLHLDRNMLHQTLSLFQRFNGDVTLPDGESHRCRDSAEQHSSPEGTDLIEILLRSWPSPALPASLSSSAHRTFGPSTSFGPLNVLSWHTGPPGAPPCHLLKLACALLGAAISLLSSTLAMHNTNANTLTCSAALLKPISQLNMDYSSSCDSLPPLCRSKRFSDEENSVLVREVKARKDVIYGNKGVYTGFNEVREAWDEISHIVSNVEGITRTAAKCRKRFSHIRQRGSQKYAAFRRIMNKPIKTDDTNGFYEDRLEIGLKEEPIEDSSDADEEFEEMEEDSDSETSSTIVQSNSQKSVSPEELPFLETQQSGFNMLEKELLGVRQSISSLNTHLKRVETQLRPIGHIAESLQRIAAAVELLSN